MPDFGRGTVPVVMEAERRGVGKLLRLLVVWMMAVAVILQLGVLLPAQPLASATPNTVVSLTFDDGLASQWAAYQPLVDHGMSGTFYINSARVGLGTTLSLSQIHSLAAAGNEVGGHTLDHVDLTSLSQGEQAREVCDDRAQLMEWGFRVTSFAYPHGAANIHTRDTVHECGYNNARLAGGLVPSSTCSGCPWAESIPPHDPYRIKTPNSVKSTTTLKDLQDQVVQAEQHGGGWVPLVFHHICDGCSDLNVSPALFSAFLDWLQPRQGLGTVVKTIDQVIGGAVERALAGPAPRLSSSVQNPSLETDSNADRVPDCFQQSGYGTSIATWTRTEDAHSGSWGQTLTVTGYSSGDRKLLVRQDTGTCSPSVREGNRYMVGAWYKSTVSLKMVIYYRGAGGRWAYWAISPAFPSSSTWRQAAWTTPALPAGADLLSFGLQVAAAGTVVSDDYSVAVSDDPAGNRQGRRSA